MRRYAGGLLAVLAIAPAAHAATPPVLRSQIPAGSGTTEFLGDQPEGARTIDGAISDWNGRLPGFGGAIAYSRGELVYEDHIFDPDEADLSEVRLGANDAGGLDLLARTTTMKDDAPGTALLVLLDTRPGDTSRDVPFNSGLKTSKGDVAVFLAGAHGAWVDLETPGDVHALPAGSVATNAAGYTNAIEARLPAGLLGDSAQSVDVAVASGLANADGNGLKTLDLQPNVANVAFRTHEPSRNWWD